MKRDYNREFEQIVTSLDGRRPRLLLQVCCAPCLSGVLGRVREAFDVTLFYCNPNTHPAEEYEKRYNEIPKLLRAAGAEDIPLIRADYEPERFFEAVRGLEGEPEGGRRCGVCFRLRLEPAAALATAEGFDFFCSTLTVSPYKNAPLINEVGEALSKEYGAAWLPSDFKKRDGYLRSIRLSREYGLYRQCWCGCVFSAREAQGKN